MHMLRHAFGAIASAEETLDYLARSKLAKNCLHVVLGMEAAGDMTPFFCVRGTPTA